jgi:hypothetical protein
MTGMLLKEKFDIRSIRGDALELKKVFEPIGAVPGSAYKVSKFSGISAGLSRF